MIAVDLAKKNKRLKKDGMPMLFSYHLLAIPVRYKTRHISTNGNSSGRELRQHFVRGHFKARKTGVFFWSAYRRGNPKLGFVHKDYALGEEAAVIPRVPLRQALNDPALLAHAIPGPTRLPMRTLMIAANGEELHPDERLLFTQLTQRKHEPLCRVDRLWSSRDAVQVAQKLWGACGSLT
jgi:hypothetical protein